jgi:hypothetical protein
MQAWELFFMVASTMPPSKEFVGLVSEYVHTVAHGDAEVDEEARSLAGRTWGALKRSAKAGPRRTVSIRSPQQDACTIALLSSWLYMNAI